MKSSHLKFFITFFFTFGQVNADILVLNFNKNNSSVETVHNYAESIQTEVHVYPDKTITTLSKTSIKEIVSTISKNSIKTLVITGHHSPGVFSGKNGELSIKSLLDALLKYQNISNSIEQIILTGCYTARTNEIIKASQWRNKLPNLNYLSGYDGRSWSSETNFSKNYIFDSLAKADIFIKSTSTQTTIENFENFRDYDKSTLALWFKTDNNEYYISSESLNKNNSILDFNKLEKTCVLNNSTRLNYYDEIKKYDLGKNEGYLRPPLNIKKGKLRKIYNWMMKNQHCITLAFWDKRYYDDISKTAGLLFFDRLTKNYLNVFNPRELEYLVKEYNKDTSSKFIPPDILRASRYDIRQFVSTLSTEIYNKESNLAIKSISENILAGLDYHLNGMSNYILQMDPFLTPTRWLTENNSRVRPSMTKSKVGNLYGFHQISEDILNNKYN